MPFVSIIFVVAGYWYTSIVYRHFGIDPTQFFSLGDYVASSIEQIQHTLLGLVAYFLGMLHGWRAQYTISNQARIEGARQKFKIDLLLFTFSLFVLITILLEHGIFARVDIVAFANHARFAAIGFFQLPIAYISVSYFKNSQTVYALLMFGSIFFSSLYIGAQERIAQIEKNESSAQFVVYFGAGCALEESSAIIGSNSAFLFMMSENGNIKIIPWNEVESVALEP